ncbi:MAG: hypothetical protein LDLANPLL_01458 [Turneriella sp.]|nr:hypothetical protein [Turneriella sp.]
MACLRLRSANTLLFGLFFNSLLAELSLDLDELIAEVAALTMDDFYKSMTTYEDYTRWHDVYHKRVLHGMAYIKVQIDSGQTVVISFKEK